jgi:hypothetical protein
MLIRFRFKNYTSFKDECVLSLVASPDKALAEENSVEVPSFGKRRLLRSAVAFGANASGKSNLIQAFAFVREFVRRSLDEDPGSGIPVAPFLLDPESARAPSEFELAFIHDGVRYDYGLSVDRERVHEEWLIAYPKGLPQKWFERSLPTGNGTPRWRFGSSLKGEKERLIQLTRPDSLFLSVAARFNHPQLTGAYGWISDHLQVLHADTAGWTPRSTAKRAREDAGFRSTLVDLLRFADLGVVGLEVEPVDRAAALGGLAGDLRNALGTARNGLDAALRLLGEEPEAFAEAFDVKLKHRTGDPAAPGVPLQYDYESEGTRRLFALAAPWLAALSSGRTLVVDELGASLHPLLVRLLVGMFHDPRVNTRNAQLIFDTHDTTLLDPALFRRDQIWFLEKDPAGASHLYPLLDFSPRKDEALAKGYLRGRYGAIPVLGDLDWLGQNGQG